MDNRKKPIIVATYNFIDDYPDGIYNGRNRKVVVHSSGLYIKGVDKMLEEATPKKVEKVYYYFGRNFSQVRADFARKLVRAGNKLTIVACGCNQPYMGWLREDLEQLGRVYIPFIWSECGGTQTLSEIVRRELEA